MHLRLYHWFVAETPPLQSGVILVLGVGNSMKGDDGVGPYVARILMTGDLCHDRSGRRSSLHAIDCGTTPENHTSVIRRMRPSRLIIVDAAEMGLAVGACRVIPVERAGALGLSTHSMPLSLFAAYVGELVPDILLIGVQPRSMAFGAAMSEDVRKAGEALALKLAQGGFSGLEVID